ncbi:MAG: hypothetical protein HQL69_04060 [Magnetococcales bacterium]|nr:hypothetical protein [Magnetococcales bacterium]
MLAEKEFIKKILEHPSVKLIKELSANPAFPTWLLSNSTIVSVLSSKQKQTNYALVGRVFNFLSPILFKIPGVMQLILFLMTIPAAFKWLAIGRQGGVIKEDGKPFRIFVAHNSGAEDSLLKYYTSLQPTLPVKVINTTDPISFNNISRLPTRQLVIKLLWSYTIGVFKLCNGNDFKWLTNNQRVCLYIEAKRHMAKLACFQAWWQNFAKNHKVEEVCFLTSAEIAHGFYSSSLAVPTIYLQHGSLLINVLQLSFDRVVALNNYDKIYLDLVSKSSNISVYPAKNRIANLRPSVLFTSSPYDDYKEATNLKILRKLISWCHEQGLQFILRKHPRELDDFWEQHLPTQVFDSPDRTLEESFIFYRPLFVVAWFSTTLNDAHEHGIIPVVLQSGSAKRYLDDIVYPLQDNFLTWPENMTELQNIIHKQQFAKLDTEKTN